MQVTLQEDVVHFGWGSPPISMVFTVVKCQKKQKKQDLWHNYSLVKTAIGEECHGPSKAKGGQMNLLPWAAGLFNAGHSISIHLWCH